MLKGITRSNNLWNEDYTEISNSIKYVPIYVGDGEFTLSTTTPYTLALAEVFLLSGNVSAGAATATNGAWDGHSTTASSVNGYVTIAFRIYSSAAANPADYQTMLNSGSSPLPYEPYQISHDISRITMRSKQLWDGETVKSYIGGSSPSFTYKTGSGTSVILRCTPETTYTITRPTESSNRFSIGTSEQYPENNHELTVILRNNTNYTSYTFTTDSSASYIIAYLSSDNGTDLTGLMVHIGDQPIPYVPYGMVEGWEVRDQQGEIIWGADKTLTGTDSITYKGYGLDIKNYEIDGNMTQAAGVYPKNPIYPIECGDLTENLCYLDKDGYRLDNNGDEVELATFQIMRGIVSPDTTYTIDSEFEGTGTSTLRICQYSAPNTFIKATEFNLNNVPVQITTESNTAYIRFSIGKVASDIMMNSGSTAKPYEPYGKYKLPIINNGTTQKIYLNQPIRKIGNYSDIINSDGTVTRSLYKVILTGSDSETWAKRSSPENSYMFTLASTGNPSGTGGSTDAISTHFIVNYRVSYLVSGEFYIGGSTLSFRNDDCTDLAAWKQFLSSQYSAGTPLTVWYVLQTPTTESTTTPILTTSIGTNTVEVDTTLSPSKIDITLHGKYAMWNAIRNDVRTGVAPKKYPIGTILYDSLDGTTGTAFEVVAYDHHFDPSLTAQGYTHSMTLCELKLNDVYQFDATEAFLYTDTDLAAGTYKFTIPNYDATYGGNKTYYFTSTASLPKNSQIVMDWSYNQTPKTVTAYSPTSSITAMENTTAATGWNNLTLTEYVDGESPSATDLGTIAGPSTQAGTSNYGQMNHIHRARYGSNNYLQSGLRQYLNASTAANTWWKPQTVFDRPYANRNQAGKLSKLNQNLVSVLATPSIQSRTNSYFETTSLDGTTFTVNTNYNITTDKLFLLSPMEVGFNTTDTTVGTLLDYYIAGTSDPANAKRVKIRTSTNAAYYWWLRTPNPSHGHNVRSVNSSGALHSNTADNSLGSAAACIIQ